MTVRPPGIFVALILVWILRPDVCALDLTARSISPSGQFIIYGGDIATRGAISALAEKSKSNLLTTLRRPDNWKIAIVVNLRSRAANLPEIPDVSLGFSRTEAGLKLQLDLTVSDQLRAARIERELVRVILLGMIYRNQTGIAPGKEFVDPPKWLIDGLLASAPDRDRTSIATSVSALKHVLSLQEFLQQLPTSLDSAAKELYQAYSFVLVQLLIESPNGTVQLGHYIDNLVPGSNDPLLDLQAAFPGVRDLEKSWRSNIGKTKSEQGLLTFSRSEERLNRVLNSSPQLAKFTRLKPTPAQVIALRRLGDELLLLTAHANPVQRPIVRSYQQIAGQLALGKNRGLAERLAELEILRRKVSVRMTEVDDYLNWFEAAKPETPSGLFDDSAADSEERKAKRKDPLSLYLNAVEMEF